MDKRAKYNKTRRKRKKRRKKHGGRHKGATAIDQSRREDSVRPAAREKREYLDKAFWDSVDSGYEEPLIYHSMDMASVESNANGESEIKKEKKLDDAGGKKYVLQ